MVKQSLPSRVKLPLRTPVRIIHSDCKGKQIIENAVALTDGISTRSSLPVKLLANIKTSWWTVYFSPDPTQPKRSCYSSSVSTKSLCEGNRLIAMCKKSKIPKGIRGKYACHVTTYTKSLEETINDSQDSSQLDLAELVLLVLVNRKLQMLVFNLLTQAKLPHY